MNDTFFSAAKHPAILPTSRDYHFPPRVVEMSDIDEFRKQYWHFLDNQKMVKTHDYNVW